MRHRWGGRKLGRTTSHRLAMLRNMVTSLLEHEQIETTDARAKEVRRMAERMITLGKRGDLHARRLAMRVVRTREVATKLFDELAPRYQARPGGYTRVLKTRRRVGDAAPLSLIELVDREGGAAPGTSEAPAPAGKRSRGQAKPESRAATKPKAKAKAKAEPEAEAKPRRRGKATAGKAKQAAVKPTKQRTKV
jgi:large subunit ribosomal protein L17